MSYLSAPRLVFSGQFQADPSTVNNDPQHFDSRVFRQNYQLPGEGATNGWWNPRGTGAWRFRNCFVTSAVYRDGTTCSDPNVDPVVGAAVNDTNMRVEGKLVDLDPEQQMVSQIWGFQILLSPALAGATGIPPLGFKSDFTPVAFADIWTRYAQGQPDSFFGAFYQSVLTSIQGYIAGGSRLLSEWMADGKAPAQLSIRFNVDGFDDDATSPTFTFGRVVGAIGLYQPGEPLHFVAGRALWPGPKSALNTAYAQVTGSVLNLDLGNSLPTQSAGGPLADDGPLALVSQPAGGQPTVIGAINYLGKDWYERTAGIVSFPLTSDQSQAIAKAPLYLVQPGSPTPQALLSEAPNGSFLRADDFVFRLNPGDSATTTFYATNFGQPAAGQNISLGYDPTLMAGQTTQGPVPGPQVVGEPTSALPIPATPLVTGQDGTAQLTLQAGDPGNPRIYIDGQLYGISYAAGNHPPPVGSVQNPSQILNALVWSGFKAPPKPTWMRDVQPVLQQYANLYPIMLPVLDLGNYASVLSRRQIMKIVFSASMPDPNYMPVTRDMSEAKRAMICKWLDAPHYMSLDSVADLHAALQQAIELEHSTIPPYLCALYSIKPGVNEEVSGLIRSVVMEEMLHMALVSNLLISLGGSPRIGHPTFVPRYPGPLPGGLRGSLTVRLRRCSIEQVRDVFMSIEQPEDTVEVTRGKVKPTDPTEVSFFTIGWFYDELTKALKRLSKEGKIQFGHADRQVSQWHGPGKLIVITSLDDALAAINEIKEQGEGASKLNPDDKQHELAHYYKFSEIVAGRRIELTRNGYAYTGEPVPFDPSGVWPMMDDPDLAKYPPGSRAYILAEQFARTYQALLNGLHRTFNGEPGYLNQAIGLMYSLSLSARELMQTPSGLPDGTTAGPTFQLPFPE